MDSKELLKFKCQYFVNGAWAEAESSSCISVTNPGTGKRLGAVPDVSAAEVNDTIQFAKQAFTKWRSVLPKVKSDILYRWHELLLEHESTLAEIITLEQGKPLAESKAEVRYAASYLKWFAEESSRIYGDVIPANIPGQKIWVQKQAIGVCACITPWNFPLAMLARKVSAALAAGCTVVAKPSELTPFTAMAFAELSLKAGVPAGVFNVVTGNAKLIGEVFCSSPVVKKISFTGSTAVGQLLIEQSSKNVQKLSLELGGNAPFIVFEDADIDSAVHGYMQAKFRNSGQTCISPNRLFVHKDIYAEFLCRLKSKIEKLRVGYGVDPGITLGSLINTAAVEKFNRHLDDAVSQGAVACLGGRHMGQDLFVKPTLLKDAKVGMAFCDEETFSPLVAAVEFETEEQVLVWANDSVSGLSAYVYSQNLNRILRMVDELEVGMVAINAPNLSNAAAPFGGVKQSGFGREGSKYGLDDFLQMKYVLVGGE